MRNIVILRLLLAVLFAVAGASVRAQEADAKLNAFFKDYLDAYFRLRPLEATRMGDHRYDSLLENLLPQSRVAWTELARKTVGDLGRQVDYAKLSRAGQIDFEIFQHELNYEIWLSENTHPYEEDPRVYNDYINDSVYLLLTQSTLPRETNVSNAIARMALIPKIIAAARQNLHNPPRVHTETAIDQNEGAIRFFQVEVFEAAGPTRQSAALKAAAAGAVSALKEYQHFLTNDLLPRANGDWRLGAERFAKKLDFELNANITADQLAADAQSEFDRVERDMYVIARQLWSRCYPTLPLPPDDVPGRRQTVQRVLEVIAKDHTRPENLMQDTRRRVARLKKFIEDNDILRLPKPDRTEVIEMPEFRRGNATAYMEPAPPLDPNASGNIAVSPPLKKWGPGRINSFLEEYNNHMLDVLMIHEGYPGHAVQLDYANRNPSLIRRVFQSGVYTEGWAVYTEQMMLDQGYGAGDLALRLSQLKFYLRAVANAILDHKMHYGTITDEEALRFLVDRCFQSEEEARGKIVRAKQSSCQLSTYFAGRMAHYRLRQEVEREQGDKFDLSRFHEAVLAPGAVPVKYLPELVRSRLGMKPVGK
jgi:uncharacterized protein (DUF885 family)